MSRFGKLSVMTLALSVSAPAMAAPEEIQVYLDDLTAPGRFGSDVHTNYVLSGPRTPDYPGALASNHLFRFTPEFYYGLTETVELGLYLPTTAAPGAGAHYEGEKLRLKYIAPHDEKNGPFRGWNSIPKSPTKRGAGFSSASGATTSSARFGTSAVSRHSARCCMRSSMRRCRKKSTSTQASGAA